VAFSSSRSGFLEIWLADPDGSNAVQLTSMAAVPGFPTWSPDGRSIAFTSNRTADPDGNENTDVFLVQAKAGAVPRRLTTSPGTDGAPVFSPDGRSILTTAADNSRKRRSIGIPP
jgi:Tol biopolymer transport system component